MSVVELRLLPVRVYFLPNMYSAACTGQQHVSVRNGFLFFCFRICSENKSFAEYNCNIQNILSP